MRIRVWWDGQSSAADNNNKKIDKIILEKPPLYLPGAVALDPDYPIESLWEL